jgi:hypothetical protein
MKKSLLQQFVRGVIVEGRIEDVQKKFPDINVSDLVAGQPAGTNNKYLEWCAKQVAAGEAPALVLAIVSEFHSVRDKMPQKDLNFYKTLPQLRDAIPKKEQSKAQKTAQVKSSADRIYEDDRFLVVRPNTRQASCLYGAGTRWCTAATQGNQFKNYSARNARFYYVIDKKNADDKEWSKVAYVKVDTGGRGTVDVDIYNAQDRNVPVDELRKQLGPEFAAVEKKINEFDEQNKQTWHTKLIMDLPIEQVQAMWKTFDEEEKLELLAKSPSLRPQDLARFAKSPNAMYRKTVAERKVLPPEVVSVLANDPEVAIRLAVVERQDLPEDMLALFVKDESANVRLAVAKNKRSGPLLGTLIKDKVQPVRLAAYNNKSLDPALFSNVPDDPDPYIRLGALRHAKSFPAGVLDMLKRDTDPIISDRARKVAA